MYAIDRRLHVNSCCWPIAWYLFLPNRATEEYQKQSLKSLLYAARAKNIKNHTIINLDVIGHSNLNKVCLYPLQCPHPRPSSCTCISSLVTLIHIHTLTYIQVSSEIENLKRRLRDRAAEFDRLCRQEKDGGDDHPGDRKTLLRKLEELGQANAREKKELEEKLSKVSAWTMMKSVNLSLSLSPPTFFSCVAVCRSSWIKLVNYPPKGRSSLVSSIVFMMNWVVIDTLVSNSKKKLSIYVGP